MLQVGLPSTSVFFYSFTHPHQCDLVEDELSVTELNWSKFCRNEVAFKKKASDQHQSNVASAALAWLSPSSFPCFVVVVVYLTARYALRSTKYVLSLRHGPLNMGRVILNMVIRSHLSRMRNGVKYARTNTSKHL